MVQIVFFLTVIKTIFIRCYYQKPQKLVLLYINLYNLTYW